ncbi:MAG: GntR family transcriptional regulator [Chloroflexota bacterium]
MGRPTVTVQLANGQAVEVRLDRDAGVPLQSQLFEQLKHFIGTRRIEQGQRLPSVRQLARDLSLSPVTVSRAFAELEARGLVEARQGSGVFVVDFTQIDTATGPQAGRLRDFAAAVVSQARRLGYESDALAEAIRAAGASLGRRDTRLIAVVDEFDSVDPQVDQLVAALSGDGVRVVGLRLDEMEARADVIDRAGVIASAPHCFGLVRQQLQERQEDVIGLTMTLSEDVRARLRRIEPSSSVVVVGTLPSFLSWMSYLIRLQVPLHTDPIEVAMTDEAAVRRAVARADVVVYGSGVRHRLPPMLPQGLEAIELRHIPDEESIANLRNHLDRIADQGILRQGGAA